MMITFFLKYLNIILLKSFFTVKSYIYNQLNDQSPKSKNGGFRKLIEESVTERQKPLISKSLSRNGLAVFEENN